MLHVAYASRFTVRVKFGIIAHLTAQLGGTPHARRTLPQLVGLETQLATGLDSPFVQSITECHTIDTLNIGLDKSGFGKYIHYGKNTSGSVHILYMVMRVGCHLAEHRSLARKAVYVNHREIGSGFIGHSQQVKHRVCRAPHRNIKRHGVKHGLTCGYTARQHTLISVAIIGIGILNNLAGGFLEKLATVGVGSHNRTVARKSHTYGFVERIHRIGGKHSRARATCRTSLLLKQCHTMVRHRVISSLYHNIYKVYILTLDIAGLHRSARHKYSGNI